MAENRVSESYRTQLETLQTRIGLHGNRMWQLPLTYLATIALSLSAATSDNMNVPTEIVFSILTVLGIILTWCLYGAYEGYARTAKNMQDVEEKLGIGVFTRSYRSHSYPYFLLMIFGIVCCAAATNYH